MSDDVNQPNGPRERSTYSSWDDDYRGFDAREDESGTLSFLVVALAVGVILVFGMVVWNTYRSDKGDGADNAHIIKAEDKGFKSRLEEPAETASTTQKERLFDAVSDDASKPADVATTTVNKSAVEPVDGIPRDIRPKPTETPSVDVSTTPKPAPTTRPQPTLPLSKFDQSGQYLVQLGALRTTDAAQLAWSQMVESYPDLFSGAVMDIERADLGAKGIFYRVRTAAFADRSAAVDFCDKLKARGESCIVAAR